MHTRTRIELAGSALIVLALFAVSLFQAPQAASPVPGTQTSTGHTPTLAFEPNVGQTNNSVRYLARTPGTTVYFTPSEVVFSLSSAQPAANQGRRVPGLAVPARPTLSTSVVRRSHIGANPYPAFLSGEPLTGRVNYMRGNDSAAWRTNIPTYSGITYKSLYPGIDLTYSGDPANLNSLYSLSPHADPTLIRWQTNSPDLHEAAPAAWQTINNTRTSIPISLITNSDSTTSFNLGPYNPAYLLNISHQTSIQSAIRDSQSAIQTPGLAFSTYLGGSDGDSIYSVTVDSEQNIYVLGGSNSTDFPIDETSTEGESAPDIFVIKLNPSGTAAIFATFLGGSNIDWSKDIEIDGAGNIAVAGHTYSSDFPTMNPRQPALNGWFDAFVFKLNPQGSAFVFSTFLGGSNGEMAEGVAIDPSGNVYASGFTRSTDFPVANAIQPLARGDLGDAFVTKYSPDGQSVIYSTYLGGDSPNTEDTAFDVAADSAGNAYLAGETTSLNFPVFNAFQPEYQGGESDGFVVKLNPTGSAFIYSTYLGGGSAGTGADGAFAIATDSAGNTYITGNTDSEDFPTRNPIQPSKVGFYDAFITKLNPTGSDTVFSTFLGGDGAGNELGLGIDVNASGEVAVVGYTDSPNFPTSNAIQSTYRGAIDSFAVKLHPSGAPASFVTYLGGSNSDYGRHAAIDDAGNVYAVGFTASVNFPVASAFQDHYAGNGDAFITKISDPTGGTPTPAPTSTPTPTIAPTNTTPPTHTPGNSTATSLPANTSTSIPTSTPTSPSVTPTPVCEVAFTDVPTGSTFYEAVQCIACRGIITGYTSGCETGNPCFHPGNNITRGQIAKIASTSAGFSEPVGAQQFEDVAPGHTFYDHIWRLADREIISGYPCGGPGEPCGAGNLPYFRPNNQVTRGQIAKVIANTAAFNDTPSGQQFEDVDPASTFYPFIYRLSIRAIMSGYACGGPGEPCGAGNLPYFRPNNNTTRGQAAKIVANTFFPACTTGRQHEN